MTITSWTMTLQQITFEAFHRSCHIPDRYKIASYQKCHNLQKYSTKATSATAVDLQRHQMENGLSENDYTKTSSLDQRKHLFIHCWFPQTPEVQYQTNTYLQTSAERKSITNWLVPAEYKSVFSLINSAVNMALTTFATECLVAALCCGAIAAVPRGQ